MTYSILNNTAFVLSLHAMLDIFTEVCDMKQNNEFNGLLMQDAEKAFDTISHETIISKLNHYGIRGVAHHLFFSITKTLRDVGSGPQGSTLGPLLFLIYITDVISATKFNSVLFADDTHINVHSPNLNNLEEKMNKEIDNAQLWTNTYKLTINAKKSCAILVPPIQQLTSKITLNCQNSDMVLKESAKYLGIALDNELTFHNHITAIENKIASAVGLMFKLVSLKDFAAHLSRVLPVKGSTNETFLREI